jgi:pimeloyl-ACP methyl ester carboxylesterase
MQFLSLLEQSLQTVLAQCWVGIPPWREHGCSQHRTVGVWDPQLVREICVLPDGRHLTYFVDGPCPLLQGENVNLPVVLCLHAMMLSGNAFITSVPPTQYTLVCVNRSGYFGSSPGDDSDFSYTHAARDLQFLLYEHLQLSASQQPLVVLGHSSGGPLALAVAHVLQQQQVQNLRLLLLSPDPEYALPTIPDKPLWKRFVLGWVLPTLLQILAWTTGDLLGARGLVQGMKQDYRMETSLYDFDVEQCIAPNSINRAYIAVGDKDTMLPPTLVQHHVAARLPTESTTFVTLPGVTHLGILNETVWVPLLENVLQDWMAAVVPPTTSSVHDIV